MMCFIIGTKFFFRFIYLPSYLCRELASNYESNVAVSYCVCGRPQMLRWVSSIQYIRKPQAQL